ncbi:MAG: hypothetical protein CL609_10815 [Anaerolineaceae bacterium]|nr:hypothetical protein [Anaerolineaceae bacterium]
MPQTDMPVLRDGWLHLADHPGIAVDSKAWFSWLTQANRFCYWPTTSTFRLTVRKEKRRHAYYWYAYLKHARKLHNAYVGRTEAVTRDRLQRVLVHLMHKIALDRPKAHDGYT